MLDKREISTILETKWVWKVGKHVVKLAFPDAHAKEYWMTEKQLSMLEHHFFQTPNGYSTQRCTVYGYFDGKYYAYSSLERQTFIAPEEQDLSDLEDDDVPW